MSSEKEMVEGVWQLWKAKVIKAAEKGIGKKKVNEHSKGWWSTEVEMCSNLRWPGIRTPLLRSLKLLGSNSTQLNSTHCISTTLDLYTDGGG